MLYTYEPTGVSSRVHSHMNELGCYQHVAVGPVSFILHSVNEKKHSCSFSMETETKFQVVG